MTENNNAAAIITAARELGRSETLRPEQKKIGSLDVLIDQKGTVTSLEKFGDSPRRKRANVQLYEAASFIDYLNRHKLPGRTIVFGEATELGGSFSAILDYHQQERDPKAEAVASDGTAAPVVAGWGEHSAELNLKTTPEWGRWIQHNGRLMPQEAFAEFIEDNLNDIIKPDAATILEMAQGLQGKKLVNFKAGKNLQSGAIQLEYTETVEVNGSTNRRDDNFKVPAGFTLGIVPFVGANGVEIEARLRFRIGNDGKLSFAYILNRPYKVIEDAFIVTRHDIEERTGLPVLLGDGNIVGL